jgi:flagellar biosynthesis/type III secretory pathway protein FliH
LSKFIQNPAAAEIASANPEAAVAPPCQGIQGFVPRRVRLHDRRPSMEGKANSPPRLLHAARETDDAADAEAFQREAFRHGHEEGERAGIEKGAEQYREAIAAFGRSALQVATLKTRLRREAEQDLVALAFAIARKILRREVSVDPAAVVGLVRGCLEQYSRAEPASLRVHPDDSAMLAEFFEQNPAPHLEIVEDAKLSRGGAILETSRGVLDARFEVQLEEIEKGLADR